VIINHHSIAYSLINISAKNYRNRLMWVESIVCNISVVFFWDTVYYTVTVLLTDLTSHTHLAARVSLTHFILSQLRINFSGKLIKLVPPDVRF